MPKTRQFRNSILVLAIAIGPLATAARGPALLFPSTAVAAENSAEPTGQRRDAVAALGRIEPDGGVVLLGVPSTPEAVNGPLVTRLLVKAGDQISTGQLLAETDVTTLETATLAVATAELKLAESRAEMAKGEEQNACSRADVARRTSVRRSNLRKNGAASEEEADVAASDAKALSGACDAARTATVAAAAAVEVARAKASRSEIAVERSRVRAPFDARVLRVIANPGELVQAQGLMRIGKVGRMFAIAEVYETDIGRVHPGQKATVTSKALSAPLTGVVDRIRLEVRKQDVTGTDPAARKDARIVEVEVLLDQPEAVASLTHLQVEVLIHP